MKRWSGMTLVVVTYTALCVPEARAVCIFTWSSGSGVFNGNVFALTTGNGMLYAAGFSVDAAGVRSDYIAQCDGTAWSYIGGVMNAQITALAFYNGQLIAAGKFTKAGGKAVNRIARWDGASWQKLSTGMNGPVDALTVYNGELIAAGRFTTAGAITRSVDGVTQVVPQPVANIARWNGKKWLPLGAGRSTPVYALTVQTPPPGGAGPGYLIAGGDPGYVPGVSNIARWDGSSWIPLGNGLPDLIVYALAFYRGRLIAGGDYTPVGEFNPARSAVICQWNGSGWSDLAGLSTMVEAGRHWQDKVLALAAYNDELFVGGLLGPNYLAPEFSLDYHDSRAIHKWNGSVWTELHHGVDKVVWSLTPYNGYLVVGGCFGMVNGRPMDKLAYWTPRCAFTTEAEH